MVEEEHKSLLMYRL